MRVCVWGGGEGEEGRGRFKCKVDKFHDGMDMELFCTNVVVLGVVLIL